MVPHTDLGRAVEAAAASPTFLGRLGPSTLVTPGCRPGWVMVFGCSSATVVADPGRCRPVPAPARRREAGGELLAAKVGAGARRRAPSETPWRRGVSAGSDAPAPDCAACGGQQGQSVFGPGGPKSSLRSSAFCWKFSPRPSIPTHTHTP